MIPNQRLLELSEQNLPIVDAFKLADDILMQGVSGITDLITTPGLINVDFADVKSVMWGAGSAVMGIGSARGDDRANQAADRAISSPMLEMSVQGARGVLLSVAGSSEMSLHEVNAAATTIAEHCDPDANIIFGATIDDSMGEEMRVTVIAAGFGGTIDRGRVQAPATEIGAEGDGPVSPEGPPVDGSADGGDPFDVDIPDFLRG